MSARESQTKSIIIGPILFIVIAILLTIRLCKGLDLSDEAYYAFFISDWLMGGIQNSKLITLHQTAALIVYPAARCYHVIVGSTDGLFLFLRSLFLFGNIIAALCWIHFLRQLGYTVSAWMSGLVVLAFIPFGLPAPSYNTLAAQSIVIALASLGCGFITKSSKWLFISAIATTLSTIAYPSLLFFALSLYALYFVLKTKNPAYRAYPWFLSFSLVIGWSLVIYTLSYTKLSQSFRFLSTINEPLDVFKKLHFISNLLSTNKLFSLLCFFSSVVGISRQYLNGGILMFAMSAILCCLFFLDPVFFVSAHDAISLLALMGLGLLADLRPSASEKARIMAVIYTASLVAACITGATALHSVFNFCMGAIPAACLALLLPLAKPKRFLNLLPACLTLILILRTSLFFFYGETNYAGPIQRIKTGFFAGISTHKDNISLLSITSASLSPLLPTMKSIAIFSRLPGMVLGAPVSIKMPFVYPLIPSINANGIKATEAYYLHSENRPDVVLIYHDRYLNPVNPMAAYFDKWYERISSAKTPLGELVIYLQRS